MGRQRAAQEHFESALRAAASLRAPVLLAHTQLDYAEALQSGARAGPVDPRRRRHRARSWDCPRWPGGRPSWADDACGGRLPERYPGADP